MATTDVPQNERAQMEVPSKWSGAAIVAWSAGLLNVLVLIMGVELERDNGPFFVIFVLLALVQIIAGVWAFVQSLVLLGRSRRGELPYGPTIIRFVMGITAVLFGVIGGFFGLLLLAFSGASGFGGAWGRPLRVKGKQLHPELREGADWTEGERPSRAGLDDATARALEALWLHDAQKEHASVPAFSRISWLLGAVGAPADLMTWSHRAALEEIDHAQRCFALAAGYGGRTFTVEPMPDLLLGGLGDVKDPLVTLAVESLKDGCLLEDFNADVAGTCAEVCEEPVTKKVLLQIAREERSHAEFSWALITWLLAKHHERVRPALEKALTELERVRRPTNATPEKQTLIDAANPFDLRRHGRLEDHEWAAAWNKRLQETRAKMQLALKVERHLTTGAGNTTFGPTKMSHDQSLTR